MFIKVSDEYALESDANCWAISKWEKDSSTKGGRHRQILWYNSIEEAEIIEDINDSDKNEFINNLGGHIPDFNSLPERNEEANSVEKAKKDNQGLKKSKKSSKLELIVKKLMKVVTKLRKEPKL